MPKEMGMPKYGQGLNREIVGAVNRGAIREPFSVRDAVNFAHSRGWYPPETYTRVTLANATSETHSETYGKYFYRVAEGLYRVREEFRGREWS